MARVVPLLLLLAATQLVINFLTNGWPSWRERDAVHVPAAARSTLEAAPACELDTHQSAWERAGCQRFEKVCVDQGQLILYQSQFQGLAQLSPGAGLPQVEVDATRVFRFPWCSRKHGCFAGAGDGAAPARGGKYTAYTPGRLAPLPVRPASSLEPVGYLRHPAFSTCTVPVLLYPIWPNNFAHVLCDFAGSLHHLLQQTPWREHVKPVIVTPMMGLGLTRPQADVLPPLANLSVATLADFSRRLADGELGQRPPVGARSSGGNPATEAAPVSWEGGEQRCFDTLFVCGKQLEPRAIYGAGQTVVQHVLSRQRTQQQRQQAAGASAQHAAARSQQLRVSFVLREDGSRRRLVNTEELLGVCNRWSSRPESESTEGMTAACTKAATSGVAEGVAVAQRSDVLVGLHGAQLSNANFMAPGSSVIEIISYGFDDLVPGAANAFSNLAAEDPSSQLLWFVIVLCDPEAWRPTFSEARPVDRSTQLPGSALEAALGLVAQLRGDRRRWLAELYGRGMHRINVGPGGRLTRGGRCPPSEDSTMQS
eukprot:scaffold14.g1146.t1